MVVVFYSFRKLADHAYCFILTCVGHSQRRTGPYDGERVVVGFQDHLFGRVRDCNTVKKKIGQSAGFCPACDHQSRRWPMAGPETPDSVETNTFRAPVGRVRSTAFVTPGRRRSAGQRRESTSTQSF